ncbi:MAG: hypothetical protein E7283_02595 [Lachnospiraceae bacterium]|nr:hypothetical protein [Lachnospiraceae bacterium]
MNVSGVSPTAGIYSYNSIRLNELRNQQIMASKEAHMQQPEEPDLKIDESVQLEQTYTSYDYAQEYRAGETYELKGEDSDINTLDVAKAVSDLDKDQILQQYQYFVGEASYAAAKENAAEMPLRSGENFIL